MSEPEENAQSGNDIDNHSISTSDENTNSDFGSINTIGKEKVCKQRSLFNMLLLSQWGLVAIILAYYIFSVVRLDFIFVIPILMYMIAVFIITLLQMFLKNDYMLIAAKTMLSIIPLLFVYSYLIMLIVGVFSGIFLAWFVPELIQLFKQNIEHTSFAVAFCLIIMLVSIIVCSAEFVNYKKVNADKAEELTDKYSRHSRRKVMLADLSLAVIFALVLLFPFIKNKSSIFFITMSVFFAINFVCGLLFKKFKAVNVKVIIGSLAFIWYFIFTGGIKLFEIYVDVGEVGKAVPYETLTAVTLYIIMSIILSYQLKLQTDYKKLLSRRLI